MELEVTDTSSKGQQPGLSLQDTDLPCLFTFSFSSSFAHYCSSTLSRFSCTMSALWQTLLVPALAMALCLLQNPQLMDTYQAMAASLVHTKIVVLLVLSSVLRGSVFTLAAKDVEPASDPAMI